MLAVCLSVLGEQSDKDLFLEFFSRYEKKLYHVALSILQDPTLAEDAVQEAFLRVARHFKTFKKIFEKKLSGNRTLGRYHSEERFHRHSAQAGQGGRLSGGMGPALPGGGGGGNGL